MSEGANSSAQTCENSLTTLKDEDKSDAPPAATTYIGRRPRFGTGNAPTSPFIWVDGRKLRSALAYTKKWPPRRVSFPTNDTHLVTGYLEPANPWRHAENVNREDLISAYKESCARHKADPFESVLVQLENLDISDERCKELILKGETLDQNHSEPLEEIFKRIQFNKVDLEGTSLNDETSVILFDMLEYYESTKHLNISCNPDIGVRGWQACSRLIKKTQCLEQLEAKDVTLNEQYMNILSRALRLVCHLHVLKLENCGLSGRCIVILVTALKMNTGIRELYLADNGLDLYDAIQLGSLLRINSHIQLLDISNNNVQDDGVRDILEGLINQVNDNKDGKGLSILVLWNNRLTKNSSPYLSRIISLSRSLETLNVGQNMLTNEMLNIVKEPLKKNHILLQLGMQSTEITCEGAIALAEVMEQNQILQRIDLRDNSIQMTGMRALAAVMQKNKSITQLDLDDKPRIKIDGTLRQYMDLVDEIRGYCIRNEKNRQSDESTDDSDHLHRDNRSCSASSRKISLTCQTLPCTPSPIHPISSNETGRSMLEPKRTSGGRLRSPAPSPIPSPVASPIPSPSRSRFVVSRVAEASLRSTDSSASSSPVTPPSFEPLSTCFFPPASGSSRFRVSIVEAANVAPSPKAVAASKANVTIGFNFTVDSVESIDSDDDSVFKSELENIDSSDIEDVCDCSKNTNNLVESVIYDTHARSAEALANVSDVKADRCTSETSTESDYGETIIAMESEIHCGQKSKHSTSTVEPETVSFVESIEKEKYLYSDTAECKNDAPENISFTEDTKLCYRSTATNESTAAHTEDSIEKLADAPIDETTENPASTKKDSSVQKHASSLEKFLALFQHPSSFFSESPSANQPESKNPLQDSVNSMLAFGDKFQQYLREGRSTWKSNSAETCAQQLDVSSLGTKKPAKSLNVTQLSSIQSLANMFTSFKLDSTVNGSESKSSNEVKDANCSSSEDERTEESNLVDERSLLEDETVNVSSRKEEADISSSNNRPLPENVQSKDNEGHTSVELALEEKVVSLNEETCSSLVNSTSPIAVPESKTTVCVPNLTNIPEYSDLGISDNNTERESTCESVERINSIRVEEICDRKATDSINLTSDSNSASCNITCDIRVIGNVNTVSAPDHAEDSVNVHEGNTEAPSSAFYVATCHYELYDIANANSGATEPSAESNDRLENEVTNTCYVDNNNDKEGFVDSCDSFARETDTVNTCQVDVFPRWKSTTVNSKVKVTISELSLISKDTVSTFNSNCVNSNQSSSDGCIAGFMAAPRTQASTEFLPEDESSALEAGSSVRDVQASTEAAVDNVTETTVSTDEAQQVREKAESDPGLVDENSVLRFEKTDTEDLIFCITDISGEGIPVEEDLFSPKDWANGVAKAAHSFYSSPQTSSSSTNLLIESSETVHRSSQDSGIEEANLSALEENIPESNQSLPREIFQESVDSGIESECSSVCVKSDSGINGTNEPTALRETLDDVIISNACGQINDIRDFRSDTMVSQEMNADRSYLQKIKNAVVSSACSMSEMSMQNAAPIEVAAEESDIVIAENSAMVHTTSPKTYE